MIGGTDFSLTNQFNRAWQAHRQPGFVVQTLRLHRSDRFGMSRHDHRRHAGLVSDGRRHRVVAGDDDGSYMGAITLRKALALSRNVVAVKLADQVGWTA